MCKSIRQSFVIMVSVHCASLDYNEHSLYVAHLYSTSSAEGLFMTTSSQTCG